MSASVEISHISEKGTGFRARDVETGMVWGQIHERPFCFLSLTHACTHILSHSVITSNSHACMYARIIYRYLYVCTPPDSTGTNLQLRQRGGTQQHGRREHTRERCARPALNLSIDFRFPITPSNGAQDGGMSVSRYVCGPDHFQRTPPGENPSALVSFCTHQNT